VRSTYVPGLDELLGGGLAPASLCLVKGGPGTGRTSLGLQVAAYGAVAGEPALYLSLEDDRERVLAAAHSLGLPVEDAERAGTLRLLSTGGASLAADLRANPGWLELAVLESGAERLVVDGLGPLVAEAPQFATRSGMATLRTALTQHGVTCLLTADEGTAETAVMAHVADAVISLSLDRQYGGATRQLSVDKQRGAETHPGHVRLGFGVGGLYAGGEEAAPERGAPVSGRRDLAAWPGVSLRRASGY
jgi:circadian clock protein KaiC